MLREGDPSLRAGMSLMHASDSEHMSLVWQGRRQGGGRKGELKVESLTFRG